jgi:O-antigen/teichoic acid export membrane protein
VLKTKTIFQSQFLRGIVAIASSNSLSQVIPILIIPFLTRIYSPDDFGFVAVLVSISSILSVFASGKFELALVLTRNKQERIRLFTLCLALLTVFICFLTIITCLIFLADYLFVLPFEIDIRYMFLPLVVFLIAVSNIFYNYVNSEKKFKELALSSIIYSLVKNGVALAFYFASSVGLVIGELVGRVSFLFYLKKTFSDDGLIVKPTRFSYEKNKDLIKKYKKFPIYTIPSESLDVYTKQVPVYLMSFLNLISSVGFYALTDKVLNKPISIVGRAVSVTFRVRAAEDFIKYKDCRPILLKTLFLLIVLSILPFTILYLYAIEIFSWVFGDEWAKAGLYARILIPVFFMQFVTSPLTYIFHIAGKQEVDFYLHILMAIGLTISFFYGFYIEGSIEQALSFYAYANGFVYFLYLLFSIKFSKSVC